MEGRVGRAGRYSPGTVRRAPEYHSEGSSGSKFARQATSALAMDAEPIRTLPFEVRSDQGETDGDTPEGVGVGVGVSVGVGVGVSTRSPNSTETVMR